METIVNLAKFIGIIVGLYFAINGFGLSVND